MSKILEGNDNRQYERVSRWIKINQAENVTPRNSLYYYSFDGAGYPPNSEYFNPAEYGGPYVDYFRHGGRKYAIGQFITAPIWGAKHISLSDGSYICGYDAEGCLYRPLMIEVDECGEYARLYQDVTKAW